MSEHADTSGRPGPGMAWIGYGGAALVLFALVWASVNEVWDVGCTLATAAGGIGLFCWGLIQRGALQKRARTRGVRYGSQTAVTAVLLLAVLVLINFLTTRHNPRIDTTEAGLFSLAPQTRQALHAMTKDVRVLAFFPVSRRAQAADLLQRYAAETRHLQYELIDPDQDPDQARRYGVTAYGTVVVEAVSAPGQRVASASSIRVEADPAGKAGLALSEEKLTNAVLKAARGKAKTLYFLEGHGEGDIANSEMNGYARLRAALENQAYTVKPLFLARTPEVPADCAALVVAGPSREPLPDEMAAMQKYLEHGGKALFLLDPAPGASLSHFLDGWGVVVSDDLIVDVSGAGRVYGAGAAMPLVNDYNAQHPITHSFRQMTFFPFARSVAPKQTPGDAMVESLAQTSAQSFAEPYTGGARHARFDPGHDRKGPLSLAVAGTRDTASGKQARLAVIGCSNFVSNSFFDKAGNGGFFLNCVHWLAEEEEMIALRPRPRQDHRVQLTEQQARGIFWLVVVAMPLAALAAGGIVLWRRR